MYPFFRPPSTTSGILCNVNAKNGTSRCCSLVQGSVRLSFLDAAKWAVICTLIFNMIKYYKLISSQSAVRMPVQAMHPERFSKHFLQLFSVRSLHNNLKISSRKNFGSLCASFRKWFSNRNAPTRAYIDEPRPRRHSSSLAGKIIHPSYPCLAINYKAARHSAYAECTRIKPQSSLKQTLYRPCTRVRASYTVAQHASNM